MLSVRWTDVENLTSWMVSENNKLYNTYWRTNNNNSSSWHSFDTVRSWLFDFVINSRDNAPAAIFFCLFVLLLL